MQTVSQAKEPAATVSETNGATSYQLTRKAVEADQPQMNADLRRWLRLMARGPPGKLHNSSPYAACRAEGLVEGAAFPVCLALLLR
jgi:hypothetical protein